MLRTVLVCVVAFLSGPPLARASMVKLDTIVVANGGVPILTDDFDTGVIESFWFQIGSPGPESGSFVELDPGDGLFALISTDPLLDTLVAASYDVSALAPTAGVLLALVGAEPGDVLALGLFSGTALMFSDAGLLGAVPFPPAATAEFLLAAYPGGTVGGLINGIPVFIGSDSFGAAGAVATLVVPEPMGLAMLASGLLLACASHRRFR